MTTEEELKRLQEKVDVLEKQLKENNEGDEKRHKEIKELQESQHKDNIKWKKIETFITPLTLIGGAITWFVSKAKNENNKSKS